MLFLGVAKAVLMRDVQAIACLLKGFGFLLLLSFVRGKDRYNMDT